MPGSARKLVIGLLAVGGALILYGLWPGGTGAVAKDLKRYVDRDLAPARALESQIAVLQDRVLGTTDHDALRTVIRNEALPLQAKFEEAVMAVEPRTEEVKAVHLGIVEAAKTLRSALADIETAIEAGDDGGLVLAKAQLRRGQGLAEKWRSDLHLLAGKVGLKLM